MLLSFSKGAREIGLAGRMICPNVGYAGVLACASVADAKEQVSRRDYEALMI